MIHEEKNIFELIRECKEGTKITCRLRPTEAKFMSAFSTWFTRYMPMGGMKSDQRRFELCWNAAVKHTIEFGRECPMDMDAMIYTHNKNCKWNDGQPCDNLTMGGYCKTEPMESGVGVKITSFTSCCRPDKRTIKSKPQKATHTA
jgi:hypothetical protein